MKGPIQSIDEWLSSLRQYFQTGGGRDADTEKSLLRAEIFSLDQMEQLARQIAREHTISYEDSSEQLLKRLADNEDLLVRVTTLLQHAVQQKNAHCARGGMAARQLLSHRRADPAGQTLFAQRIQQGPAQAYHGASCRLPACV